MNLRFVEAGYAKARGKKVIYLRKRSTEHSTIVAGLSGYHIIYKNEMDFGLAIFSYYIWYFKK